MVWWYGSTATISYHTTPHHTTPYHTTTTCLECCNDDFGCNHGTCHPVGGRIIWSCVGADFKEVLPRVAAVAAAVVVTQYYGTGCGRCIPPSRPNCSRRRLVWTIIVIIIIHPPLCGPWDPLEMPGIGLWWRAPGVSGNDNFCCWRMHHHPPTQTTMHLLPPTTMCKPFGPATIPTRKIIKITTISVSTPVCPTMNDGWDT